MACAPAAPAANCGKALQRRAQIAFGIDEKIGAGDDLLAGFHALGHLDPIAALRAEAHRARLEAAFAAIDAAPPGARRYR